VWDLARREWHEHRHRVRREVLIRRQDRRLDTILGYASEPEGRFEPGGAGADDENTDSLLIAHDFLLGLHARRITSTGTGLEPCTPAQRIGGLFSHSHCVKHIPHLLEARHRVRWRQAETVTQGRREYGDERVDQDRSSTMATPWPEPTQIPRQP
jgi:hypothetical protein